MKGRRITIAARARDAGLPPYLVNNRIAIGWTVERALTTPECDQDAIEERNAKARARTIKAMAEHEAKARARTIEAKARGRIAETLRKEHRHDLEQPYYPNHVTAREELDSYRNRIGLSPFDRPGLADGFIGRHADALAVADAEVYDAAFDPDFSFGCGWRDDQQRKREQL